MSNVSVPMAGKIFWMLSDGITKPRVQPKTLMETRPVFAGYPALIWTKPCGNLTPPESDWMRPFTVSF